MGRKPFYAYSSTQSGTTVHQANSLASGIAVGVIQCLLWLWMAWKTKSGRNWARVLSSLFFGFMCLGLLSAAAMRTDGESVTIATAPNPLALRRKMTG